MVVLVANGKLKIGVLSTTTYMAVIPLISNMVLALHVLLHLLTYCG